MKNQTYIDSLGIRIDVVSALEQQQLLDNIIKLSKSYNLPFRASPKNGNGYAPIYRYYIYQNSRVITSIQTSSYVKKTKQNATVLREIIYCIKLDFAGLKSYNQTQDASILRFMIAIVVMLNNNKVSFKLINLDIALDMQYKFKNILALCTSRVPNTKYFKLKAKQEYASTQYIEVPSLRSVSTAYLYNKSEKEKIDADITRMEIKFKPRFFSSYGLDFARIEKNLNRYYVLYFQRLVDKQALCDAYDAIDNPKQRDLKKLHLEQYRRISFDVRRVEYFIGLLFEAYDTEEYYNILHDEFYSERYK